MEGYSPRVLRKAVRQASKMPFKEASEDLRELAGIQISPTHLQRLSERIGTEWAAERDREVEQFRDGTLPCSYAEKSAPAAAVMLDGGRLQIRADDAERGVHDPHWRETKVACCLSLSSRETLVDPQPEPPAKFLEPTEVARLALEIKSRGRPSLGREERAASAQDDKKPKAPRKRKKKRRVQTLVRTVVATMADSETFGWQMAAEVQRRGLDRAKRKACVCDGQRYNWTLFEMHLLAYLYDAAHAWHGRDRATGWQQYERWVRWAWSGKVNLLLKSLREAVATVGTAPTNAKDDDRRLILQETLGYVENNRMRMDYPAYRRQGLPISSAPVESTIKQLNRRVKATEKFWLKTGAEALLQLRAAYLSADDRIDRHWNRPRPHRRAAGEGRIAQPGQAA